LSIETLLTELTAALDRNTAALTTAAASAPSAKAAAASKTKPPKDTPTQSQVQSAPATIQAAPPAAVAPAPESSTTLSQKVVADAVLALAKVNRDAAVAILGKFNAARFAQVAQSDYAAFYAEIQAAQAEHDAKTKAASDPASLV
jgi:hypothetical protein